jgi:hypothetical protein
MNSPAFYPIFVLKTEPTGPSNEPITAPIQPPIILPTVAPTTEPAPALIEFLTRP